MDREIAISSTFGVPAVLLSDAFTKPELVRRWLLGPDGWTMPVCEIDLRLGGTYRYVWRKEGVRDMGISVRNCRENVANGCRRGSSGNLWVGFGVSQGCPMTSIDAAIVDLTEALCRRLQLLTGRTNVWLAMQLTNLSIVVYFVWVAALYVSSGDLAIRIFVALFCGGVFLVLMRTLFRIPIEASEGDAYRRVSKGLRNPKRVRDVQLRISFLSLSIILAGPVLLVYRSLHLHLVLVAYLLTVLTTVVLYVLACDPLPPCAGKIREWIGAMSHGRMVPVESTPRRRAMRRNSGRR